MKITAFTVSVNYSDVLLKILSNKISVDNWIVITHESDTKTLGVIKQNRLNYFLSNEFFKRGKPFRKGAAIDEALRNEAPDDWIMTLDSDILLPPNFADVCVDVVTDKDTLYGADRFEESGVKINETDKLGNSVHGIFGYLQIWHSSKFRRYPRDSGTCEGDDLTHYKAFGKTALLPLCVTDVFPIHKKFWGGRDILKNRL